MLLTFWSVLFAILAGLDLGYGLDAFIHQHNIWMGILWILLTIVMTYNSIAHFRRPTQYVEVEEIEDDNDEQ